MVEEYGTFERTIPKDRDKVKLNKIRKVHQVTFNGSSLTALPLSCLSCARLQAQCDTCVLLPPTVPEMKLAKLLRKEIRIVQDVEGVEEEQEDGMSIVAMPNDVLEQSDSEVEESSEEFEVGDIVWGLRYGKRQPAIIVPLSEVPLPHQKSIRSKKVGILLGSLFH